MKLIQTWTAAKNIKEKDQKKTKLFENRISNCHNLNRNLIENCMKVKKCKISLTAE